MKHFDGLHTPSQLIDLPCHAIKIQDPLSEAEILTLQDRFLSNGFQHIKVKDITTGRLLIQAFLNSLGIYHNTACVTTVDVSLQETVTNVYHELMIGGHLDPLEPRFLDEFFIEEFYFDFLWIEMTNALINSSWYKYFEKKLLDYKLDQHIPMIVLSTQHV